jgi:putative tricarboxylic transport membrane protein
MIFVALPAIAVAQRVMTVSRRQLYAVVLVLCIIGAYATNQNIFDVKVMVCFGIFGYLIKAWGLSPPALLIAFILGPMAEVNLRQALEISNGSIAIFASKPISAVFLALALATILWSATAGNRRRLSLRTEN